ncbi:MAG: NAD(P)/FAD-dependent oxidoreductase, partial [Acidimicrobiales bacterium]
AGATILAGQEADELLVEDDAVIGVRTGSGDLMADNVIVAAGIDLPQVLATIGLDLAMNNEAGMLARTTAGDAMIDTILVAKDVHVWRRDDGGYLIGADFGGGEEPDDAEEQATRVLADLQRLLSGTDACSIENVTVRERPMPRDGRPAIGPFGPKGLYLVSTHSGMTLAPVVSECVAAEIGSGAPDPRLAPYRPDRPALRPMGPTLDV